MGWLFTDQSQHELIRDLLRPQEGDTVSSVILDSQRTTDALWVLVELTAKQDGAVGLPKVGDKLNVIYCHLLQSSEGQWGYKSMDESSHPYYYTCPLRFLERAPVQSAAWRESVQAFHARQIASGVAAA